METLNIPFEKKAIQMNMDQAKMILELAGFASSHYRFDIHIAHEPDYKNVKIIDAHDEYHCVTPAEINVPREIAIEKGMRIISIPTYKITGYERK